jgi:hypothetical protein
MYKGDRRQAQSSKRSKGGEYARECTPRGKGGCNNGHRRYMGLGEAVKYYVLDADLQTMWAAPLGLTIGQLLDKARQ